MRFCIALSIAAIASGCSSASDSAGEQASPPPVIASAPLPEESIIEIARRTIQDKEPWMNRLEFSKPECRPDGTWHVFAWRLPRAENGFRFIKLDKLGKVTEYMHGAAYRGLAEEPFAEAVPGINHPETK